MKKKLIILTSCLLFITLLIFYISSIFIMLNANTEKSKIELKDYLSIAIKAFDGSNEEEVANLFNNNKDLRLTIISENGEVLFDSFSEIDFDNHLKREEIQNLGEIVERKSESYNEKMYYIAAFDDGYYVRVALRQTYITNSIITYIIGGSIILVSSLALAIFLLLVLSKKIVAPINSSILRLENIISSNNNLKIETIEELPLVTNLIEDEFQEKIKEIKNEKAKTESILKEMNQGLVIIDDKRVVLVNKEALKLFKVEYDNVYQKDYIYLIRNIHLQEAIADCIYHNKEQDITLEIDGRYYFFTIKRFFSKWLKEGVLISFLDITERQNMEIIKKDFFQNASHELKSPLTSIIGYEQMIVSGILEDKDEIKEASLNILKEAKRMNQIIIDMLELSNLEYQKSFNLSLVNLKEVVEDTIKRYTKKANDKNITIETDLNEVIINTSFNEFETLVSNLIDNAIKYNKINGHIKVKLTKAYLEVYDTGIGISKENQTRIFERFYRVDKAKSKLSGGTGLGLAIVKHICEKLNYKVRVESVVNEYTKFTIYFN